jgi:hypothetical protein
MVRWQVATPSVQRRNLWALAPRSTIPNPEVALTLSPLSWLALGTGAASLVKCTAAERPGGQPTGPPKLRKSRRVGRVSESWRVEDRRYGVGEGPGRLE